MLIGMVLKLQKNPREFLRDAYRRAELELGTTGTETTASAGTLAIAQLYADRLKTPRMTEPTLYLPVLLGDRCHYALLDSGAEISVMTTSFANFAQLVEANHANVAQADIAITGVNGVRSALELLQTNLTLGGRADEARTFNVLFGVYDGH